MMLGLHLGPVHMGSQVPLMLASLDMLSLKKPLTND